MLELFGAIVVMYAVVAGGYWLVNKRAELRQTAEEPIGKERE